MDRRTRMACWHLFNVVLYLVANLIYPKAMNSEDVKCRKSVTLKS
jgi:hypothetical protein